jgi:hypothetical protein
LRVLIPLGARDSLGRFCVRCREIKQARMAVINRLADKMIKSISNKRARMAAPASWAGTRDNFPAWSEDIKRLYTFMLEWQLITLYTALATSKAPPHFIPCF